MLGFEFLDDNEKRFAIVMILAMHCQSFAKFVVHCCVVRFTRSNRSNMAVPLFFLKLSGNAHEIFLERPFPLRAICLCVIGIFVRTQQLTNDLSSAGKSHFASLSVLGITLLLGFSIDFAHGLSLWAENRKRAFFKKKKLQNEIFN